MDYLRRDRMYTYAKNSAKGFQGNSGSQSGSWGHKSFINKNDIYSELELYSIQTTFSLVENLWIDLSMASSQVCTQLSPF